MKFTQWVADNVDHNICTLTGKGTFHGMGIISICPYPIQRFNAIKRLKHKQFTGFVDAVDIVPFHGSSQHGLLKLRFKPIKDLASTILQSPEMNLDLLWQTAWFLTSKESPRPNWSGLMQHATTSNSIYQKASIKFLPIIDMNPSDETCIYSTLQFVMSQADKLGISTPCITFDQPLWLKATGIIKNKDLNIACRLGGFHTLMSFLCSIGNFMAGSGLAEVFEEVYAEHTVNHVLSGKAVARSLRAHMLVQSALMAHIIDAMADNGEIEPLEFESVYKNVMDNGMSKDEIIELGNSDAFKRVKSAISAFIKKKKRCFSYSSVMASVYGIC